ncbi:hypothetical protein L228DRAFT_156930 [Xylona heveae TC161]|uniref:Uncharacterized protein n=1 Tax=Xylona heveae (strain CBS 132557 / TC161) TaxID=1328760 RepID=A0A165G244_XYLHT|nr:hypothetical protein L228DRAFT_156930 [Xylona heveae TC161]KZF21651.1 hypothetical protein L228DRAFT_156930 [Xylona heveae TC161]
MTCDAQDGKGNLHRNHFSSALSTSPRPFSFSSKFLNCLLFPICSFPSSSFPIVFNRLDFLSFALEHTQCDNDTCRTSNHRPFAFSHSVVINCCSIGFSADCSSSGDLISVKSVHLDRKRPTQVSPQRLQTAEKIRATTTTTQIKTGTYH